MNNPNINKHRRIIAYIFLVLGLLSLVVGIVSINTFYLIEEWFEPDLPASFDLGLITIHNPFHWLILFPYINLMAAVFKIVAAIGIFQEQSWGHKLALVIAFFWFFKFPLGTGFSFYILYAFLEHRGSQTVDSKDNAEKAPEE